MNEISLLIPIAVGISIVGFARLLRGQRGGWMLQACAGFATMLSLILMPDPVLPLDWVGRLALVALYFTLGYLARRLNRKSANAK